MFDVAAPRCYVSPRRLQRPCKVRAVAAGTDKQQSKPQNSAQAMEAAEKRWESQVRADVMWEENLSLVTSLFKWVDHTKQQAEYF